MIVSRLAALTAASIVALAAFTVVAGAAPPPTVQTATTNSSANLRQGPGTSYGSVDTLQANTDVIVHACTDAWCAVTADGENGFVYKPLLDFGDVADNSDDSDDEDNAPPPPKPPKPKPHPQRDAGVCFFQFPNFNGPSFCAQGGDGGNVPFPFRGKIRSVLIDAGVEVEVCAGKHLNGQCKTLDHSVQSLPYSANIGSYQVGGDDGGHYSGPGDNGDDQNGDDNDDEGDDDSDN